MAGTIYEDWGRLVGSGLRRRIEVSVPIYACIANARYLTVHFLIL